MSTTTALMQSKITNQLIIIIILVFINSCGIKSPSKYKKSKLSNIVAAQTNTIIEESVSEDITELNKKIASLQKQINQLETKKNDTMWQDKKHTLLNFTTNPNNVFVFFDKNNISLDKISIRFLDYWRLNALTNKLENNKIRIIAHSDFTGDSIQNIKLTELRNNIVVKYLKNNFCINDTNIISVNMPNIKNCNLELYRSVKVEIVN
jgi:outer membrane protein OmpA-like peptidoglycan-associated protein